MDQVIKYGLHYIAVGVVVYAIIPDAVTTVIGVGYPAFKSFMSLESPEKNDDRQWLTYWICLGAFNLLDNLGGFLLDLIPFYSIIKVVVLIWLQHPKSMGALTLYTLVMH